MPTDFYALCNTCFLSLVCAVHAGRDGTSAAVTIASPSNEYVLGQPVQLIVTVENVGQQDLQAWAGPQVDQIQVYIACESSDFQRYTRGEYDHADSERPVERVPPAKSKVYTLRVLYTFYEKETPQRRCRLAFGQPGVWLVKVRYPLYPDRQMFESNTIRVQIRQPEGADDRVWKQINTRAFLYFLQSGLVHADHRDVVAKAVELLHAIPKTSYHPALRWALAEYYKGHRLEGKEKQLVEQVLSPEDLRKIRALRGEREVAQRRRGPFPDDPRLDAQVTFRYPKETAWEQVLKDLSEQTGVRLRVAPEIRFRGGMASLEVTKSLRTMMDVATGSRAKWVRDGDGYRLVPAPEPEEKRPAGAKSNDQQPP